MGLIFNFFCLRADDLKAQIDTQSVINDQTTNRRQMVQAIPTLKKVENTRYKTFCTVYQARQFSLQNVGVILKP